MKIIKTRNTKTNTFTGAKGESKYTEFYSQLGKCSADIKNADSSEKIEKAAYDLSLYMREAFPSQRGLATCLENNMTTMNVKAFSWDKLIELCDIVVESDNTVRKQEVNNFFGEMDSHFDREFVNFLENTWETAWQDGNDSVAFESTSNNLVESYKLVKEELSYLKHDGWSHHKSYKRLEKVANEMSDILKEIDNL